VVFAIIGVAWFGGLLSYCTDLHGAALQNIFDDYTNETQCQNAVRAGKGSTDSNTHATR
jgi:hypothetical protein